jgi:hypothetical protein
MELQIALMEMMKPHQYVKTNAGHHTKEGVLSSIVNVPTRNWMSVAMTVSLGTLKWLVYVSKA